MGLRLAYDWLFSLLTGLADDGLIPLLTGLAGDGWTIGFLFSFVFS